MTSLKYLLPRLALLGILGLGVWASSELLTRKAINQTQLLHPLEIEVDQSSVQWADRSLTLRNLQVGGLGLGQFRADKVTLRLDQDALLQQRWVVLDGMLTNPSVVGPDASAPGQTGSKLGLAVQLEDALRRAGRPTDQYESLPKLAIEPTWWQRIEAAGRQTAQPGSHTRQAVEVLQAKWNRQLEQCRQQTEVLNRQIAAARGLAQQPVNPLRSDARLELTQQVNQLTAGLIQLRDQVDDLRRRAEIELAALAETAEGEIRSFESALRLPEAPAHGFDLDLLAQPLPEPLGQVFQWVEWAGAVVPPVDGQGATGRGRNVAFGNGELPTLEIQKLTLVGVTDVGGQYYRLMGSLNHLSNRPFAQRYPTSLSLRAQGDNHVVINGLYDQRNGHKKAYFSIRSLDLTRAEGLPLLASAQDRVGFPIQVAPGKYAAQLNLQLDGEKVDGQLVIRHSQTSLDYDTHRVADAHLSERIRQELQQIQSYTVTYRLQGTVHHLVASGQSDLGQQIAQALSLSTQEHFSDLVERQSAAVKHLVLNQRQQLESWVDGQTRQLMAAVQQGQTQIASLQEAVEQPDTRRLR